MNIKIKKYVIKDEKIPYELSGYRIALFSDSHNAYYGENSEFILSKIKEIEPDIVLFAGDGNNTKHSAVDPGVGHDNLLKTFLNISKQYETYYVPGNHEHRWIRLCEDNNSNDYGDFLEELKASGVKYLDNNTVCIANEKINLCGLNLPIESYRKDYKLSVDDINNFIGKPREDTYNILLTHSPKHFKTYADWGADLSLCGHIHGGMIRLPVVGGVLSPYRQFFPKYDYGYFEKDGSKMIISSGSGDHNIRFKVVNPYEIVMIILETKE